MKNESTSNKQHSGSFPSDNVTWEEKPTKKPRIKREGNSIEKNCDIHPEISLQQIQNSQADIHKRHVKKKLAFDLSRNCVGGLGKLTKSQTPLLRFYKGPELA